MVNKHLLSGNLNQTHHVLLFIKHAKRHRMLLDHDYFFFTTSLSNKIQIYSNQCNCTTLTSVHSLLEVNRGLMVVPKPTMLSFVPEGRLFRATTIAS